MLLRLYTKVVKNVTNIVNKGTLKEAGKGAQQHETAPAVETVGGPCTGLCTPDGICPPISYSPQVTDM